MKNWKRERVLMELAYLPVHFYLKFQHSVFADTHPLFVLRSVLGKNLRSMCCIAHTEKCSSCMYNKTCAYAFIFETILSQDNTIQPGRNTASHPFSFTQNAKITDKGSIITSYDFTITLFGKAIEYLPYIYAAFVRAGKEGLFKSRIQYIVEDVTVSSNSILENSETIQVSHTPNTWKYNPDNTESKKGDVLVELLSPLRFKTAGKYTTEFNAEAFMLCLFRRMKTLCLLYGSGEEDMVYSRENDELLLTDRNLIWQDYSHYSTRQKDAMALGGALGTFKLHGTFTPLDKALLDLSKVVNAGKNTNFGLGQLNVWQQWEN